MKPRLIPGQRPEGPPDLSGQSPRGSMVRIWTTLDELKLTDGTSFQGAFVEIENARGIKVMNCALSVDTARILRDLLNQAGL